MEYNQLNQKIVLLKNATEKLSNSLSNTISVHEKMLDLAIIFDNMYFYSINNRYCNSQNNEYCTKVRISMG